MKDFYIADAGKRADDARGKFHSAFLVLSKQLKPKKSGGDYLALILGDRTGTLEAKMWDNIAQFERGFAADDVVMVKGYVNRFNGRPQIIVESIARLEPDKVDFGDFLPKTTKDIDQMWQLLLGYLGQIENVHLRGLVDAFVNDETIATAYRLAPAAKSMHHAFIGGLLEHVLSLMGLCEVTSAHYPQVDRDLLYTGAFLHDIGKIHELSYARSFSYTTSGQLLGHMVIELGMVADKIRGLPGFPEDLKILLEHLLISHHGEYEFGSPKLPMCPEALLLHYMDDLDSKMESMRAQFARESDNGGPWTGYNPALARPLLNSRKYLEPKNAKAESAGE